MTQSIVIRSLRLIEELEDVRRLEAKIWGEADSTPSHQTITAVKNGGLVLGAYDGERLVGFQYSFPGYNGKTSYLCSHMLGIDEEFRNKKIGEKLKIAQCEEAKKIGYPLITWTYDPLESINGYLNISKLGGVCSSYIKNCYGELEDPLNSKIPTDRFLVEWHIYQEHIPRRSSVHHLEQAVEMSLIQWKKNGDGLPVPLSAPLAGTESDKAIVAIPKNFRMIREASLKEAINWRLKTREIFTGLFQNGWQVTDFIKNDVKELPVQFYVLTKR
ncbi:GNAT family N-acetyltransferase [Fictibacillus sp. NRS-1165]|uniref:GNAT family N-acetyltransferase n=1 Tax=Fictibacillus sp. NRS-1165 TaxID=3144463 RepID=UPI003D209F51